MIRDMNRDPQKPGAKDAKAAKFFGVFSPALEQVQVRRSFQKDTGTARGFAVNFILAIVIV